MVCEFCEMQHVFFFYDDRWSLQTSCQNNNNTTQRHQKREERRICVGIAVDYHCTSVPVQAPIKQELRYIEKWKKLARLNRYTGGMYLQRVLLDTD